jgi:hypothetical protein
MQPAACRRLRACGSAHQHRYRNTDQHTTLKYNNLNFQI